MQNVENRQEQIESGSEVAIQIENILKNFRQSDQQFSPSAAEVSKNLAGRMTF